MSKQAKKFIKNRERYKKDSAESDFRSDKRRNGKQHSSGKTEGNAKFTAGSIPDRNYNDWSWYAKNEQMLRDAASFSYNRPLGSEMNMERVVSLSSLFKPSGTNRVMPTQRLASSTSVPGVMNLVTAIGPGLSTDYTSPINLAAQNIYSYVRYMNSGAKNYDPADLMMYMLSLDSGYAMWNFLKRAYGIARSYSQKNWYYPRLFIEGMGIDFDDLLNNLADFRLFLNTTAARLMSFCVPGIMPLFIRHSWMFSNIWKDSNVDKAQCYQFVPAYFFSYFEESNGGGSLTPVPWAEWESNSSIYTNQFNPVLKKFADIRIYVNSILNSLSRSEDIGVMSGDILKAYGQDKLFKLTAVEENYIVEPTYSEEVLNQIHNATIHYETWRPILDSVDSWAIKQDVNDQTILYNPKLPAFKYNQTASIINMPWNDVTPANTMVGTRLTSHSVMVVDPDNEGKFVNQFSALGTEFIVHGFIGFHNYVPNSSATVETEWYGIKTMLKIGLDTGKFTKLDMNRQYSANDMENSMDNVLQLANAQLIEYSTMLAQKEQFDWAPISYLIIESSTYRPDDPDFNNYDMTPLLGAVAGDMSNWMILDTHDLAEMHLTAIMSEFNIPQIGSF